MNQFNHLFGFRSRLTFVLLHLLCRPIHRHHWPEWPPDLWFNGRVWLWRERIVALLRTPIEPGGWRSNPWNREPSQLLPGLLILAFTLLLISRAI